MEQPLLAIRQVAQMTGISEPTLRAWERRYGFPQPVRGPGGRRRFRQEQVEQLWQVKASRESGLSLEAAIDRAKQSSAGQATVFAALAEQPGVRPVPVRKSDLRKVVHGLEDEMLASGTKPLIITAFQRERFFRQEERRYHAIARAAELTVVRADFQRSREARGISEVPLAEEDPLTREWSFICYAPSYTIALAAWELVDKPEEGDDRRLFELIWSAEAAAVRHAARTALSLAGRQEPRVVERGAPLLEAEPPPEGERYRRLAAMSNRVLGYLTAPDRLPPPTAMRG